MASSPRFVQKRGNGLRYLVIFLAPIVSLLEDRSQLLPLLCFSCLLVGYERLYKRNNILLFVLIVFQLWWALSSYILRPTVIPVPAEGYGALKTISVVLPCSGEGEFAKKTIESVYKSLVHEPKVLQEIIVVDDNSSPPLSEEILDDDFVKEHRVKILRQDSQQGLIRSKLIGGNAATGDIIVFFDCHVAPQPNWHTAFLKGMNINYKRVIIPMITHLDIDTWTQKATAGFAKCYLTWDADFKWIDSDNDDAPGLSGGLLGISRQFWTETGGYDEHMYGWGGENIDQTLRVWLCGGEMKVAFESQVAHMWRIDSRTRKNYQHIGDPSVNRMRAVQGWMGVFGDKAKYEYPLGRVKDRTGDLSNIWEVRDRLKCKPYVYYLWRFRSIFLDGGMVPEKIFGLKSNGQCLRYTSSAGTSGDGQGTVELDETCTMTDRHRFHAANRMSPKYKNVRGGLNNADNTIALSGLRAWNTDQCIEGASEGHIRTHVCIVTGVNGNQQWRLLSGKIQNVYSLRCISIDTDKLVESDCSSASIWELVDPIEPLEWREYQKGLKETPEIFV